MSRVLLSTDIGSDIDDALALLSMMNANIRLKGIYTVNGDVVSRALIAKHMVNRSGKRIPVAIGESQPLLGPEPYNHFVDCLIDESFEDPQRTEEEREPIYKTPRKAGIIEQGIQHFIQRLTTPHVVMSTGPLTTIAKIIEDHPEAARNIERLYLMGCRFSSDPKPEHNIRYDSEAARIVLQSDVPITIIPGSLCELYKMPSTIAERLISNVGLYVKHMIRAHQGIHVARMFSSYRLGNHSLEQLADSITLPAGAPDLGKQILEGREMLKNMGDPYYAAISTDEYWVQYNRLLYHFETHDFGDIGKLIAAEVKEFVPKRLQTADVYVPFCFLYPDKIKSSTGMVEVDPMGNSYKSPGSEHRIVEEIDLDAFNEYLFRTLK